MLRNTRRGQIAPILVMSSALIFGLAGLGVDLIYMMTIRARLGIAADAAALGAARSIGRGSNAAEQQTEADAMALNLFRSNFPDGHMLTSSSGYDQPLIQPGPVAGTRMVTVIGRATAPAFFMGWFGVNDLEITTRATAIRKDVNLMLVLDRSGSMNRAGAWTVLQDVAKDFVDEFDPTRDQLGLVVFGGEARRDFDPGYNFRTPIKDLIDLHVSDNAGTNIGQGFALAYQGLQNLNDPNALNVIVLFSDGAATAYTGGDLQVTGGPCAGNTMDGTVQTPTTSTSSWVWGLQRVTAPAPAVSADGYISGCSFASNKHLKYRVSTLEPTDINGYSLTGPRSVPTPLLTRGNRVRPMAANAALNAALAARTDPEIPTRVFTIGLGGEVEPPMLPLDSALLTDMANDPTSPVYDPTQPIGKYVYAPTKEQLAAAFEQVKSEVHRIMQ